MKIINQTLWDTAHLKAILQKAAEIELEPAKRKVLRVTISYTRGAHSSGCAYVGGRHATVRIRHPFSRSRRARAYRWVSRDDPRPGVETRMVAYADTGDEVIEKRVRDDAPMSDEERQRLVLRFASVAVHEFAHIRGQHHDTMSAKYKWHGNWAEYVAWAKDMPLAVKAPKAITKPSVDAKLAHVLKMKALAETRVKRATTILRKWKQRERYYAKAAQKAQS